MIGVSFSLAAFPSLSVSAAKNKMDEVVSKISSGLRQIIFWSIPITTLIVILRAHIVRLVLGSGFFDWQSTRLVAATLALFVFSLVFQNILLFLSRSHYALGRTRWPLLANILSGFISVVLGFIFLNYFFEFKSFFYLVSEILKIEDLSSTVIVLPLAFSMGSIAGSILIFLGFGRRMCLDIWRGFSGHLFKIFVSSSFLFFSSYYTLNFSDHLFDLNTFWGVFMHGALAGLVGIAVWAISLYKWGDRDIVNIAVFIKNKIS